MFKIIFQISLLVFMYLTSNLLNALPINNNEQPEGIQAHRPTEFLESIKSDSKEDVGKKIYEHYCALCHNVHPDINIAAPRIGVTGDWVMREKKGFDELYKKASEGFNNMPARGGCFECTDDMLTAAIRYMLPKT